MIEQSDRIHHARGVAFLGTYLPQQCGIATFTHDLSTAVRQQATNDQSVSVLAMKDRPEGYDYTNHVKFEIRRDHQIDYSRAADFLNFSRVGVLSLQHEYGIFGGDNGANILTLLRDLHRPVVVTCHTVLQNPNPGQKEVFDEIIARADRIVVMTQKAFEILENVYGAGSEKAALIPHGIHDVPFIDPNYYKDKFGVEGRRVLLTFGLLSRNKGIEYMIEALPEIVAKHPKTTYLVLGATHPAVVAHEGESYRLDLQRRVRELGLEDNVLFHPRFVDLDELLEYIGASDMFIAPYLNLDQITSGAMSYAMGAGKAVVATPFWHAEELLADDRGVIVPLQDSSALKTAVMNLLDDEVKLTAMRKRAYTYCRHMVWSAVARSYIQLFDTVRTQSPSTMVRASALSRTITPTNLPAPKIDHLRRLTDDTGPAHHARYTIADWTYGYRLEDAAAALVAAIKYHNTFKDAESVRLADVYFAMIHTLVREGRPIAAGLSYARQPEGTADDVATGKVLWALGYAIRHEPVRLAEPALDTFNQMLSAVDIKTPRGAAYGILGAANYMVRFAGASDVRRFMTNQVDLLQAYCGTPDWIARWNGPDWTLPVQALGIAADTLDDDALRESVTPLLETLIEHTRGGTCFKRLDTDEDEDPVAAAKFVDAIGAIFYARRENALLAPIRAAADWFLGANSARTAVYAFSTGGCHDALMASGINRNQGTEATVYCLLAFLTLHQLASVDSAEKTKTP